MYTDETFFTVTLTQTGCVMRVERRNDQFIVNTWGSCCDADDSPLTYNTLADAIVAVCEQINADCNED
jgi:hypothetical protein